MKKSVTIMLAMLIVLSMLISCVPAAPPEVVEKIVEVEKIVMETVEVEVEKIVQEVVEIQGAIPYPDGAPLTIGREPKKFNLDEMIVYKALDEYSQPEWMDALVEDGTLPPVAERLPAEPQVFLEGAMSNGLGEYGGMWRDFSACPTEGWNLGAGQTQGWFGINIIYQEALLKTGPIFLRGDAVLPFPNLAKDWEWSEDGLELTMNLIEGAKWSDGEDFNSEDVMFTWEHIILDTNVNSNTSRTTWQVDGQDITLEALDDYTIKWTFPVPFPVQKMFVMDDYDFNIVPEHIWAQYHPAFNSDADYDTFMTAWPPDRLPPVTMGPWVAVDYKTDEIMVLRRNPYYWKVDEAGKQLPYLDEVLFEKGTQGVGRTLGTLAGSIDHSNLENPGTFIETMKRQAEDDAHFYVEWGPETLGYYLQVNQSATLGVEDERDAALRELFRNVDFRRALSQAIDRDGLGQAVVRGPFLRPWAGGLFPGSPYFDKDSVVYYPYAPEATEKLLAGLGFEDTDGNGILNWTDGPLAGDDLVIALQAVEDQQASVEMAEALVALFNQVGIQINFRPVTSPTSRETNLAGNWEMEITRGAQEWAVPFTRADDIAPVTDQMPFWHVADAGERQLQPFEEELVRIVNEFKLEPNADRRQALMNEYNQIFTENLYDIGIVIGSYGLALAERFQNIPVGTPTFLYQWTWGNVQPDQVWVPEDQQLEQIRPNAIPLYGE
ncbi:MAG: ABC transporter substrate-binding protein [Chloroflexota bacterium]|nr:ABC transporter substrate-binding protein [Chloroflexota bacterium]